MTPTPGSIAPVVVAAAPAEVAKAGWKTTEAYGTMMLLGMLGEGARELIAILPTLAANPATPPWLTPMIPIAVLGLGWCAKRAMVEYTKSRVALKLPVADVTEAVAAGAAAANATNDRVLEALSK